MKKIGIIGCGKIAQIRHIPEYLNDPNAEIIAYFDLNQQRAEELAQKNGGKAYSTIEGLLADPTIDAVSVCTSNETHAQISIDAMRAGKHVLVEKPMATNIQDCERMVQVAKETGKFLMIGHNQRFAKAHQIAKQLITDGKIGEIITFRTAFGHGGPELWSVDPGANVWFFDRARSVMGAMADLGIHKTDLIQFLTGMNIIETNAKLTTLAKRDSNGDLIGVDDNAQCICTLENGAIGTITVSWTHYGNEDNSTVVYGSKGRLRIYDDPQNTLIFVGKDGTLENIKADAIQTNDDQTESGVIAEFISALTAERQPIVAGNDVLATMRAVFASALSSETGKAIQIPENKRTGK